MVTELAVVIGCVLIVLGFITAGIIVSEYQGPSQTVACPAGYTLTVQRLANGDLEYGCH